MTVARVSGRCSCGELGAGLGLQGGSVSGDVVELGLQRRQVDPVDVRRPVGWGGVGVPPGAGFGQPHRRPGVGVGRRQQQRRLDEGGGPAAGEGELDRGEQGVPRPASGRLAQGLSGREAALDEPVEVGDAAAGEDLLLPPRRRVRRS